MIAGGEGKKEKVISLRVLCHQHGLKHPEVPKYPSISLSSRLFSDVVLETALLKSVILEHSQTSKLYHLLIPFIELNHFSEEDVL